MDECRQSDLDHSIQIVGFPETESEKDDIKELTKIAKTKLGVKIKATDIVHMNRLGKRKVDKIRHVVVKMKDKQIRDTIYDQRKKLIKPGDPNSSIYLNDSLTAHRQQLLFAARKLVKARKIYAAWSQRGNVLVKKDENSKIIQVNDNCDLIKVKLIEVEQDEENRNSSGTPSRTTSDVTHLSDYDYYLDSD